MASENAKADHGLLKQDSQRPLDLSVLIFVGKLANHKSAQTLSDNIHEQKNLLFVCFQDQAIRLRNCFSTLSRILQPQALGNERSFSQSIFTPEVVHPNALLDPCHAIVCECIN